MLASFFQKAKRHSFPHSTRLDLETLEGRALMSTLGVLVVPSLAGGGYDGVSVAGTRRAGEEVPALCGGKGGGVDMDTVLLGGLRPSSDVAGIIAVHATEGANDVVLFGKAGGGGVEV
jgi:hypothetical protein